MEKSKSRARRLSPLRWWATVIGAVLVPLYILGRRSPSLATPDVSDQLPTSGAFNTSSENVDIASSKLIQSMLANADRRIAERNAWLSSDHTEGDFFSRLTNENIWYIFTPVLPCFWTFEKEPNSVIKHDGGKWLCGVQEVHEMRATLPRTDYGVGKARYNPPCIVYSFGSFNRFHFEQRVRTLAPGCEIHTFDPTIQETGDGKAFYDVYHGDYGFGGYDKEKENGKKKKSFAVKTLATILKELNHPHVDYLKVDVEGYEWEFLDTVKWDELKVGQLLIELHPQMSTPLNPKSTHQSAKDMNRIFTKLEEAGFRLMSLEPVTRTRLAQVELVFMHTSWRPDGKW